MNFTYPTSFIPSLEQQYLHKLSLIDLQQKMQMQQNLLISNMLRQREAMRLFQAGELFKQSFLTQPQTQSLNQRITPKIEEPTTTSPVMTPSFSQLPSTSVTFSKKDIRPLVLYLINNLGNASGTEIMQFREKYSRDLLLNSLIEILMKRYSFVLKTKEEMVKYTLRKALRWMRTKISKNTTESDPKSGMKTLIKQFFGGDLKAKEGFENLDSVEIVDKFMPFKKDSKIKTMNSTFVSELFCSSEFAKEYQEFLKTFSKLMTTDNNRKVEKFITFLEGCYTSGSFEKLKSFKRVPWLNSWISNTLKQAKELPNASGCKKELNKIQKGSYVPEAYEPSIEKKVKVEFVDNEADTNSTLSPQLAEESSLKN